MKIAVDIQALISESKYRGIGSYVTGILNELFAQDHQNQYELFNMYADEDITQTLQFGDNVHVHYFYMGKDAFLLEQNHVVAQDYREEYEEVVRGLYQRFIQEYDIDLFLLPSTFDIWCSYKMEWFEGTRVAVIVHDIIPILFPDEYLRVPQIKERYLKMLAFWKSADKLLTNSECVKNDLVKYIGVDPEKVDVILTGIDLSYMNQQISENDTARVHSKFGIHGEFFLFPSAADYRKNLIPTIEIFAAMPESRQYQLVVTGKMSETDQRRIDTVINDLGMKNRIILTNFVTVEELVTLYRSAKLLVFPSLYEGFGIPVMEAFACGLNVVTSGNSSLGEIAEGAAVIVDPYSKKSIEEGIRKALYEVDFSVFKEPIQQRLEKYTWKNVAARTLDIFEKMDISKEDICKDKEKLAFFAPIDTSNSMLRKCYLRMLEQLEPYFNIDVFCENGISGTILPNGMKVLNAKDFAAYSLQYPHRIYHVADRAENAYLFPIALTYPGTVVLHDENIHAGLYEYFIEKHGDWKSYTKILSQELENAEYILKKMQKKPEVAKKVVEEYPMLLSITHKAKSILTCTAHTKKILLENNIACKVTRQMLYERAWSEEAMLKLRTDYGLHLQEKVICVTGDFSSDEEMKAIIDALSGIKQDGNEFVCCILGTFSSRKQQSVRDQISKSGLSKQVRFIETDADGRIDYIEMADLNIRLGYPKAEDNIRGFLEELSNSKVLISFDDISEYVIEKGTYVPMKYNDQAYHLKDAILRILYRNTEMKEQISTNIEKIFAVNYLAKAVVGLLKNDGPPIITEQLLRKIYFRELKTRHDENDEELKKLSKTFAYIISNDCAIQEESRPEVRNQINSVEIMEEIYARLRRRGIDIQRDKR